MCTSLLAGNCSTSATTPFGSTTVTQSGKPANGATPFRVAAAGIGRLRTERRIHWQPSDRTTLVRLGIQTSGGQVSLDRIRVEVVLVLKVGPRVDNAACRGIQDHCPWPPWQNAHRTNSSTSSSSPFRWTFGTWIPREPQAVGGYEDDGLRLLLFCRDRSRTFTAGVWDPSGRPVGLDVGQKTSALTVVLRIWRGTSPSPRIA